MKCLNTLRKEERISMSVLLETRVRPGWETSSRSTRYV
jgi:hypothetical protein